MIEGVLLDSSVAIGLVFRHAGEKSACRSSLPPGLPVFCSRYVIFEIARGFLRSLCALHNFSLEYSSFSKLHIAAHSGQQRFKPYQMHTWLGAFDDYFSALEAEGEPTGGALQLEELRAKLRIWVRRGWRLLQRDFEIINEIGCREELPSPYVRGNGQLHQVLPTSECGDPQSCSLQHFVGDNANDLENVNQTLADLPETEKDAETRRRIAALHHLLNTRKGDSFDGQECYRCGDALICTEARKRAAVATKNRKHFEPITTAIGRKLYVAITATSPR